MASILNHDWRFGFRVTLLAVVIVVGAFAFAPRADAACGNESIREAQVSETLPDGTVSYPNCMALEMVSPPEKFNQYTKAAAFSFDGKRVRFRSVAALAETPLQGGLLDPYVATRTPGGWVTRATMLSPKYSSGYLGTGLPCAYSPDLSRWATWGSTKVQSALGVTTAFESRLGESFSPLSPTLVPVNQPTGDGSFTFAVPLSLCQGASVDASRFFFSINGMTYLPDDPLACCNSYEAFRDPAGTPSIVLLARDKDGTVHGGSCGARVGGQGARGAISPDASRVYFTTRQPEGTSCGGFRIMRRIQTPAGPEISELVSSECTRVSPPCSTADGHDKYQGASQEGDRALFVTTRQLTDSDLDTTADLYLHDASAPIGDRLTQLSAGEDPTPGEGAEVLGVPDFAGDGSHAYFVAKGILTAATNSTGDTAEAGEANLYLYEYPEGKTTYIGTLAGSDAATWSSAPEANAATAAPVLGPDVHDLSVGGDGHVLVFQSDESLLATDSDGGHLDIYRFNADADSLELVSEAAPGGSGDGPFDAGGRLNVENEEPLPQVANSGGEAGPQTLAFGRWASDAGQAVVFQTREALDPTDVNGKTNAYVWHEGEVTAIPFGVEPTVSMSGDAVAFTSFNKLLPEDGDGATDIYLLTAEGGFPIVAPPPPCVAEACQGPPTLQPGDQGATSEAVKSGNPPFTKSCKKGFVKRRGNCIRRTKRSKAGKRKQARPAGRKQGGRK